MVSRRPGQSRRHNLSRQVCHWSEQDLPGRETGDRPSSKTSRRCRTWARAPAFLSSWAGPAAPPPARAVGLVLWSGPEPGRSFTEREGASLCV